MISYQNANIPKLPNYAHKSYPITTVHENKYSLIISLKNKYLSASVQIIFPAPTNDSSFTFCKAIKLTKKGCYDDPGSYEKGERTLPNLLPFYPLEVNWNEGWDDYLHNLTCQ